MHTNSDNKKEKSILIVILIQIIIISILGSFLYYNSHKKNDSELKKEETIENVDDIENNKEETDSIQDDAKEVDEKKEIIFYPKPEYDFAIDEVTVEIENLDRAYRLAWVSDVHLITDYAKAEDVKIEFVDKVLERKDYFVTEDGITSKDLWPEIVKYLNYNQFDAFLFGGDLMDYCSQSNLNYLTEYYNTLNPDIPKLYVRSDHDYGYWYGRESMTERMACEYHGILFQDRDDNDNKILSFDQFVIIGINKSYRNFSESYYQKISNWISEAKKQGKQIIIMTHVPYASRVDASLKELSMQVRNQEYYWYSDLYMPDQVTEKFTNYLYEDEDYKYIFAGHLHAGWNGNISENTLQHIFEPAFKGVIGVINIIPKLESEKK